MTDCVSALAYSMVLWWSESRVTVVRDNALANLIVVCPIQFLVTSFAMAGAPGIGHGAWWRFAAVPLVFTSAFLHFELASKTTRDTEVGDRPIAWLPLVTIDLPLVSACRFLRGGVQDHPRGLPTAFVIAFYLSVIGQGLVN